MSGAKACILIGLLFLLRISTAQSATDLIFPRVIIQKDHWTGIAIANTGTAEAEVTLTAHNLDGTLFAGTGVANPVVSRIAPGSQYVRLAWQVLTAPNSLTSSPIPTRLWLEVTSPSDGLTGFFLEGHDGKDGIPDYLAGSDLSGYGTDLAIPIVENVLQSVTELSVVNPDTTEANVFLDFLAADGSVVSHQTTKVPPKGGLQSALSDLFSINYAGVAAMRVHGDRPIHCYGSVFRLSDPSLITIAGQNASLPAKSLQFPQLAVGGGWATGVGVENLSSSPILITLTVYQSDGTLFSAPTVGANPVTRQVNGGGVFRSGLKDLFQIADEPLITGWLKVETGTPAILGYVEYGAGTTRALVPAQNATYTEAFFSYQYLGSPYFTGLAILNPGSLAANVKVLSLDSSGIPIGEAQHVLQPGQKEALTMQQWVADTSGNPRANGGTVLVRADNPVTATQLWGTQTFTALANISPQQVASNFDPGGGLANLSVSPPLAVVESGKTRQFSETGAPTVGWSLENGDPGLGSISAGGLYQAPAVAPSRHDITVLASSPDGDRTAGATIDVIQRESLVTGLTLLTAEAYLDSLQRFFVAEQQLLSSAPLRESAASANTQISEVSPSAQKTTYISIANDTISQMIPLVDGSRSYLLLAGNDSGTIYRLRIDDGSKQLSSVYTGLGKPNSLALDPVTGDLLVSEEGNNQIRVIPRSQILPAAGPLARSGAAANTGGAVRALPVIAPHGVAVNPCTEAVYVTLADGTLHEIQGNRDTLLRSGLNHPAHMQVLFRTGFSCSDGLTIAVAEANDVVLIVPSKKISLPLIDGLPESNVLVFIPDGNPFTRGGEASLEIGENWPSPGASRVTTVRVGGIYQSRSPEPLAPVTNGGWAVPFKDPKGDTLATSLSAGSQLGTPDIVSVTSYSLARPTPFGYTGVPLVMLSITFSGPVAPLAAGLPNSIDGSIYLNTGSVGVQDDRLNEFNSYFLDSETGITYEVNLGKEMLIDAMTGAETPVTVSYYGPTVSVLIPNRFVDLAKTKAIVLMGNRAEITDVAPNSLVLQLAP